MNPNEARKILANPKSTEAERKPAEEVIRRNDAKPARPDGTVLKSDVPAPTPKE